MHLAVTMPTAALLAAALLAPVASQAGRVNACVADTQIGPGLTNLRDAIRSGGEVTFDCPPSTRLRVTMSHPIARATALEGGDRVTLVIARESLPAFPVAEGQQLQLRRLRLQGEAAVPVGHSSGLATVLVAANAGTTWQDVQATSLARPLFVLAGGRARIERSRFTDGSDPLRSEGGTLEIGTGTEFTRWATAVRVDRGRLDIGGAVFRRSRLELLGCELTIADARFEDNDVRAAGQSGGAIDTDCKGVIERSVFRNNRALAGGAINLRGITDLRLSRLQFEANQATTRGGALHRAAYTLFRTSPRPPLKIHHSVFRRNEAEDGGAVWVGSQLVDARAVHFAGNAAARQGGAIYGRALNVTRGTFVGNRAGLEGGALHAYIDQHPSSGLVTSTLVNTLIVRNTAPRGAGVYGSAMRVVHTTIADNDGPGLDGGQSTVTPAITVLNSLLVAAAGSACQGGGGASGVIRDGGRNLQFPQAGCPGIAVGDPLLDPLYAPVVGSAALDAVDADHCREAPVNGRDVYGEPRPQGRGCTIGAVEGAVDRLVQRRLLTRQHDLSQRAMQTLRDAVARFRERYP